MASVALPGAARRSSRVGTVLALGLLAIAGWLLIQQAEIRVSEAQLLRVVLSHVVTGGTAAVGSTVYFGLGTDDVAGLVITGMCSTVVLVAPLLVIGAALLLVPGVRPARGAVPLAIAVSIAVLCNLSRYALAAYAYQQGGMEGFELVHRYIGSLLVIVGFVGAIVLLLVMASRSARTRRASVEELPPATRAERRRREQRR